MMGRARAVAEPALAAVGLRPAAVTPSSAWTPAGARRVRGRLRQARYDAVFATAPPASAMFAARLGVAGSSVPLVVELRDLWAGNPAYEARPGALDRLERAVLRRSSAVVAVTPEAAESLGRRHPSLAGRVVVVPNGFEPELLERRLEPRPPGRPAVLLHSGTLVPGRPLRPLLEGLSRRPPGELRLVLHGYLSPESREELRGAPDVEVVPPSSWADAVERTRSADVCLITQARAVGDETAVAGKVYEYLALGRPVLCVSDGGATEALLRRVGADALLARLDDSASIDRALARIGSGDLPLPVDPDCLAPYSRETEARQLVELLDGIVAK
jgi:glycosyltransferase involved in cell wall biosynthesis